MMFIENTSLNTLRIIAGKRWNYISQISHKLKNK